MAEIRLKNLSRRWGSFVAVKNVTLHVSDGEFLVLLGPSGCGKTTTMRMIAGLEDVSQGEIWIGDRKVNGLEPKDRDIAMVFQSYGLYPTMTVYENIRFPLKVRRVPQNEHDRRVRKARATRARSRSVSVVDLPPAQRQRSRAALRASHLKMSM